MSVIGEPAARRDRPVGIFDSGVGGLSIVLEIRRQLPAEPVMYLADQANVPYGSQPLEVVRGYSQGITSFLLERNAKLIVVACNTASAAALRMLRERFPGTPFVGMEPAVKPAAEITRSKVVGVLATPATFQGELYASVVERFTEGVRVLPSTLPGLVEEIEAGNLRGEKTRAILEQAIRPLLAQGADTLVLACTHYPFVIPLIREIAGPAIEVIDPSPAIARQTARLLEKFELEIGAGARGQTTYYTTGEVEILKRQLDNLGLGSGLVLKARWSGGSLTAD
ncbi:MAG: glutamate racemase [Anaerolineales bacterium]